MFYIGNKKGSRMQNLSGGKEGFVLAILACVLFALAAYSAIVGWHAIVIAIFVGVGAFFSFVVICALIAEEHAETRQQIKAILGERK